MPRFRDPFINSRPSERPRVIDPKNPIRTVDKGALAALQRAQEKGVETAYDRFVAQQPQCQFGYRGICCRICVSGPCRIKAEEGPGSRGICGANAYTIVARNLVRYIAGGAASHSDHGRHIAETLLKVGEGKAADFAIADPEKLRRVAQRVGVDITDKEDRTIAKEVALAALEDYSRKEKETCTWLTTTITPGRRAKFDNCNIAPSAIDRTVVELLSQTTMGMDADPVNIIFGGLKTALADYTGMHIATDLSDILLGTPKPTVSEANLGTIDPAQVNIAVHGHNPLISQMVVVAARELREEAKKVGAQGINVVGICCTGNELLMREGVKMAANSASQELALMTGLVDAVILDVQCMYPSMQTVAQCFHTTVFTTNPLAKIPGSEHLAFNEETALNDARTMVRKAIDNFGRRDPNKVYPIKEKSMTVVGFSLEALTNLFASINRERPISVLTDAILAGEIKGVCLFGGCNNLKRPQDENHLTIAKELAAQDVFLISSGCAASAFAKNGLMTPAAVDAYAGAGLKKFLRRLEEANRDTLTTGLPLVFHMGACVDNVRAADLCTAMANELGVDVPKVPFAVTAPEDMHEKAIAIGAWCLAMGLPVHVGAMPPIEGSELVYGIATQIAHDVYGGYFLFEMDPQEAAKKIGSALEYRTWKLGVHKEVKGRFGTNLFLGY